MKNRSSKLFEIKRKIGTLNIFTQHQKIIKCILSCDTMNQLEVTYKWANKVLQYKKIDDYVNKYGLMAIKGKLLQIYSLRDDILTITNWKIEQLEIIKQNKSNLGKFTK